MWTNHRILQIFLSPKGSIENHYEKIVIYTLDAQNRYYKTRIGGVGGDHCEMDIKVRFLLEDPAPYWNLNYNKLNCLNDKVVKSWNLDHHEVLTIDFADDFSLQIAGAPCASLRYKITEWFL